jgi:hypothetical protein
MHYEPAGTRLASASVVPRAADDRCRRNVLSAASFDEPCPRDGSLRSRKCELRLRERPVNGRRDSVRPVRAVIGRGAAVLLCVAGVPLLVLTLVYGFFGVSISQYRPLTDDEVAYWHQAKTFSQVGFRGGYYTVDERTNPSGITPFGPHGPGFAVLYGLFGASFGWQRYSVPVLNLLALAGAMVLWVSLARLNLPRLLLAGVALFTCWHVVFWAPTGMQETLHHAGAIVLAACFASVLSSSLSSSPWRGTVALGWMVLGVLSFIRPSWIILLPLWAIATTRHAPRQIMVALAGSLLYGVIVLFAYQSTAAPYGTGFFFLRAASLSLPAQALVNNVQANLARIVRTDQYHPIELLQRYQYAVFLLAACSAIVWARRGRSQTQNQTLHLLVTAIVLGTALAAMLLLYEFASFAEHRVLSAFLVFGAMLCLAAPGRLGPLLVAGLVVWNAVNVRMALGEFQDVWRDRFVWVGQDLSEMQRAMQGKVVYRQGASRWCNTLLTSRYPSSLIEVPAGIGLSVVQKPELLHVPPRSHYMLLDDAMRSAFPVPLNLEVIATLPYGTLYVNRDSGCG